MTFIRPPTGLRETEIDPRSGLMLENVESYFAFIDDTSTIVVEELRRFFETNPRAAAYRWRGTVRDNGEIESATDSKIHVSVDHPSQAKRWPYIMVRSVSGGIQDLWLGQKAGTLVAANLSYSSFDASVAKQNGDNYEEQPYVEVGERLQGLFEMTVTLAIGTIGEGPRAECNRVTDLVLHGLVMPVRHALSKRNLDWMVGTGRFEGETLTPRQGDERNQECVRTISFGLQTSWYDDFFYLTTNVENVDMKRIYVQGLDPRL